MFNKQFPMKYKCVLHSALNIENNYHFFVKNAFTFLLNSSACSINVLWLLLGTIHKYAFGICW